MSNYIGFVLCVAFVVNTGYAVNVKLEKLSAIYLPYKYTPTTYDMSETVVEQLSYDADAKLLYTVGGNIMHVLDMSDVTNMTVIYHTSLQGVEFTDVEFCGDYLFIAISNLVDRENGMVKVYKKYNEIRGDIELIHTITVGAVPDMLHPTKDCKSVVVAVEAEPYLKDGKPVDPEGAVAIIKFPNTPAENYDLQILSFGGFNDQVESLEEHGVRFVYRGNNNTFANDVEPEYITLNHEETKAYISLQENNAIAEVDLVAGEITKIHGLGFKDWSQLAMDPSDRDGGVHMRQWPVPVFGMYQPDAIKLVTIGDADYIITANEGDSKDYDFFSEEERVEDIKLSDEFEANATRREQFQSEDQLGRLTITSQNGRNLTSGEYDALYTFGGRSFSIWRADNMYLVYDSDADIGLQTAQFCPDLFNSKVDESKQVRDTMDSRSDDKGAETENLAVAELENHIVIFVGNERPGTITMFSIDKSESNIRPKFEGMVHDVQETDDTWENLYTDRKVTMLDPEDMKYVAAEDSPNGKPLLVVGGSNSGTVTIFEINFGDLLSTSSSVRITASFLCILLLFVTRL